MSPKKRSHPFESPWKKLAAQSVRGFLCVCWLGILVFVHGALGKSALAQSQEKSDKRIKKGPVQTEGAEQRLALLVGNQQGWDGDPRLRYVLSGDLLPLAKRLRSLGFQVITLENQDAGALRRTLAKVAARIQRESQIETFLFYYSGHADQHHLHLGPRRKQPFTYTEFSRFFGRLPVARRVAIFDSCYSGEVIRKFGDLHKYRSFLRVARSKGIRRRRMIDLHPLMLPKKGNERGVRILASSLELSWEVQRYRASTFTHHLLQGLGGKADLNRDGKITLDELFDYTSQKVSFETGQKPQQLVLLERQEPYAIAPAYRARLRIGADVLGYLKVAVSNFVWVQQKKSRRALRLAVVDGMGSVFLERRGRCFRQSIRVPKGEEVTLGSRWEAVRCQRDHLRRKGLLVLPAQPYQEPTNEHGFSVALLGSLGGFKLASLQFFQGGGGLNVRFFDLFGFGIWVDYSAPQDRSFTLTHILFRPEIGLNRSFLFQGSQIKIFFGVHGIAGLILQQAKEQSESILALTLGGGVHFDLSWWFSRHVGMRMGVQGQVRHTPISQGSPLTAMGEVYLGIVFGT
ncbi:MAG: caspase family protein [Myxococcales bacterium]|nr:caspase family protein [Myxococcales bacterium]